jgi:hypothetical protein
MAMDSRWTSHCPFLDWRNMTRMDLALALAEIKLAARLDDGRHGAVKVGKRIVREQFDQFRTKIEKDGGESGSNRD